MKYVKNSLKDRSRMNPDYYLKFISNKDYVYNFLDFDQENEITIKTLNSVVNLIMYINSFPESVKDGAPLGQTLAYNHNRSKIINTHESIIDRSGVTPHFRSGHFRHLESDVYTKKKGQVVFVRSTFVSGHAKTILNNS